MPQTFGDCPLLPLNAWQNGKPLQQMFAKYSISLVLVLDVMSSATHASTQNICDVVALQAAQEFGVPISVMKAITRTETGRVKDGVLSPWPWTVNMEGAGHWFDTRKEAEAYVSKHHSGGARSYDVGCFQINYRWHGHAFASPKAMFDPLTNARYAARFMSDLFAETRDWSSAAGAYHSRTPKFAKLYRTRFDRIRSRLETGELPTITARNTAVPGPNLYPLLQPGTQASTLGSLVPKMADSNTALIRLDGGAEP